LLALTGSSSSPCISIEIERQTSVAAPDALRDAPLRPGTITFAIAAYNVIRIPKLIAGCRERLQAGVNDGARRFTTHNPPPSHLPTRDARQPGAGEGTGLCRSITYDKRQTPPP